MQLSQLGRMGPSHPFYPARSLTANLLCNLNIPFFPLFLFFSRSTSWYSQTSWVFETSVAVLNPCVLLDCVFFNTCPGQFVNVLSCSWQLCGSVQRSDLCVSPISVFFNTCDRPFCWIPSSVVVFSHCLPPCLYSVLSPVLLWFQSLCILDTHAFFANCGTMFAPSPPHNPPPLLFFNFNGGTFAA